MGGFFTKASDSIGKEALLKVGEEVLDLLDKSLSCPEWTDQALNIVERLETFVNGIDPEAVPRSDIKDRLPDIKDKLSSLRMRLAEKLSRSDPSAAAATTHTAMDWYLQDPGSGHGTPHALPSGHQPPVPMVSCSKEDGNLVAAVPGRPPQARSVALDGQIGIGTEQVETVRKEGDNSKAKKNQLAQERAVQYREVAQRVKDLEQDLRESGEFVAHRQTQLSCARNQIGSLRQKNSEYLGKIQALEIRLHELLKNLQALESQKGKEAGAYGLYSDSGATPADLRKAAEGIKVCVQNFCKELMRFTKKEWRGNKHKALQTEQGIKLARPGDVRFWIQHAIVDIAFRKLWGSDWFSVCSCPLGSDVSESQQHWYARYQLVLKDAEQIPNLLNLSDAPLAGLQDMAICYREVCVASNHPCSCGGAEFTSFCYRNLNAIEKLDIWRLVPAEDVLRIRQSCIIFLIDVWLAHMLALAFEQPACLFKVGRGHEFVKATMESAVIQEDRDEVNTEAQRRVEFTIIPGFRVGRTVIQSHVYIDASSSD